MGIHAIANFFQSLSRPAVASAPGAPAPWPTAPAPVYTPDQLAFSAPPPQAAPAVATAPSPYGVPVAQPGWPQPTWNAAPAPAMSPAWQAPSAQPGVPNQADPRMVAQLQQALAELVALEAQLSLLLQQASQSAVPGWPGMPAPLPAAAPPPPPPPLPVPPPQVYLPAPMPAPAVTPQIPSPAPSFGWPSPQPGTWMPQQPVPQMWPQAAPPAPSWPLSPPVAGPAPAVPAAAQPAPTAAPQPGVTSLPAAPTPGKPTIPLTGLPAGTRLRLAPGTSVMGFDIDGTAAIRESTPQVLDLIAKGSAMFGMFRRTYGLRAETRKDGTVMINLNELGADGQPRQKVFGGKLKVIASKPGELTLRDPDGKPASIRQGADGSLTIEHPQGTVSLMVTGQAPLIAGVDDVDNDRPLA
ncbi:MAG: hypothetical protein VKP62_11755 [Candidatus Sericytochromatia bacterium]|nr:hypothetical protein [Candidatus Sericytochromatia bacterium]